MGADWVCSSAPEVSLRPLSTLHLGLCYRESSLRKPILSGLQAFLMMTHVVCASGCMSCCLHMDRDGVLHNFARVLHVLGLQPQNLFTWGEAFKASSGRTVWVLRTKNFPGPSLQRETGDESYQFFHMTSTQGLLGILKIGTILPSAHDRIGLPDDFPAAAFFQFAEAYVPANVGQGCSAAMRKALQSLQTTVWCNVERLYYAGPH